MIDPKLITKARSRLRVARRVLEGLRAPMSPDDFMDRWYTFLTAAKNVYTVLERGSKDTAQDRQWFGAKKQQRKNDQLLQYFYQARDDDEHGIEAVAEARPGFTQVFGGSDGVRFDSIGGVTRFTPAGASPVHILHSEARIILKPVTGRGDVVYDPPRKHLGEDLTVSSPGNLGQLLYAYLESLVDEAEARA